MKIKAFEGTAILFMPDECEFPFVNLLKTPLHALSTSLYLPHKLGSRYILCVYHCGIVVWQSFVSGVCRVWSPHMIGGGPEAPRSGVQGHLANGGGGIWAQV